MLDGSPPLDGVMHVFVGVVGKKKMYSMLGLSAPETGRVKPATGLEEYTGVVVLCRLCRYRRLRQPIGFPPPAVNLLATPAVHQHRHHHRIWAQSEHIV